MSNSLCSTCTNSILCATWGEYKCMVTKGRVHGDISACSDYKRRDKNFKEPKCQCEDCMSQITEEA